jgi:hypothetical protein
MSLKQELAEYRAGWFKRVLSGLRLITMDAVF